MFQHILVVCAGNICRSPVGEALLKQRLPGKCIESAGLGAVVGYGVEPTARQLAEADGLDVAAHQARQVTVDMLHAADLILVMSDVQRRAVGNLAATVLGKTLLLGHWLDDPQCREIPDPYGKNRETFIEVHQRLKAAADAWGEKL